MENIEELKRQIAELEQENLRLKHRNKIYEKVFDKLPYGVQIFDQKGSSFLMNKAQCSILGLNKEDAESNSFNVLTDPFSVANGAAENYKSVYAGNEFHHEFEYDFSVEENSWKTHQDKVYLDETIFPLLDVSGSVEAVVAILKDVSGQKNAQADLKAAEMSAALSESRHSFLFGSTKQGVLYINSDGYVFKANPASQKIIDASESDLIGTLCSDIFKQAIHTDGTVYTSDDQPVTVCFASKRPVINQVMGVSNLRSGALQWLNVNVIPRVKAAENRLYETVLTFEDVTDFKHAIQNERLANKKASENLKQFHELFHHMEQGFALHEMVYDENGNPVDYKFLLINGAFEELTGLKASDCIGKSVLEVLPETEEVWIENYARVAQTGEPLHFQNYSQSVDRYYNVVAYSPSKGHFAVIFSDVTQNVQFEKELIIAKEAAVESDRLKTAFVQNISHEIRTPLNAIVGFSKMLKNYKLTEDKKNRYTEYIIDSSQRLLSVVTDILIISSIDSNQLKLAPVKTDLRKLLHEIQVSYGDEAILKNIVLENSVELNDWQIDVLADKAKIYQVLSNLVSNAIKFTEKGVVEFSCRLDGDDVLFVVKDSGIGINDEESKKVFDRFYQVELEDSRKYGGTGLGLSICKELVGMMGGRIWLESKVDFGSSFCFTVPYRPLCIEPNGSAEEIQKIKVLVAEDEELNYLIIEEMLGNKNVELIYAQNGKEAVDLYASEAADIVLMDIKMPVMDGKGAADAIKKVNPQVPIIAQTAYALPSDISMYSGLFDDYITKPIDFNLLISKMNGLLKARKVK